MRVKTGLRAGVGLGDVVEDLAHRTGLNKLAELYTDVTGQPCGCEQRKAFLNRLVPNV